MTVIEPGDMIEILAVKGIPDVKPGDDIAKLIFDACQKNNIKVDEGDIFVIASKIVAKAEGRLVKLSDITPSIFSIRASKIVKKDPREIEAILSASRRIIRMRRGIFLAETEFGSCRGKCRHRQKQRGKRRFCTFVTKGSRQIRKKDKKEA
jgi:Uncharacterized conserved protein